MRGERDYGAVVLAAHLKYVLACLHVAVVETVEVLTSQSQRISEEESSGGAVAEEEGRPVVRHEKA